MVYVLKKHTKSINVIKLLFLLLLQLIFVAPSFAQSSEDPVVIFQTTKGEIGMQIYASSVPNTAHNFLELAQSGFYNGLTFHRIESWCIQGGDPLGNGTGGYIDPQTGRERYLNLEINRNLRHNAPGVLAMARSNNPNSASCQFYITKSAMPSLDGQYAIFGKVIAGMRTVYAMRIGDKIVDTKVVPLAAILRGRLGGAPAPTSRPMRSSGAGSGTGIRPLPPPPSGDSGF
jgi:cyclophilin family peptidyl-prolyl cis-trans isomerase